MMVVFRRTLGLFVVIALMALSSATLRAESEIWRTVVPSQAGILRAVWGHSPQGVFAAGDGGTILYFDGAAWQAMASGTDRDLAAVWGSGPSRVFAAGKGGTLLYYDGTRWRRLDSGTGEDLHAIWGTGGGEVFAAGSNGVVLRFDGAAWRPMDSGTDAAVYGLWGNSEANVIAVGGGGRILNYNGSRWYAMKSPTGMLLRAVWGAAGSDVFAAGSGLLLHYNGRDWQDESDDLRFINCLWGTSGADVFSGGEAPAAGGGFVRRYDGTGWRDEAIAAEAPIHGIWGDGRESVYAVGGNREIGGVIYRFDGEGWHEAWRQPEESLNRRLNGLWVASDDEAFAVGDGGRVLRYDGVSWSALDSGTHDDWRGVWGMDGQIFVVGEAGVVRHYDGTRWETISDKSLKNDLNAVWGYRQPGEPGEIRLVAAGDKGILLFYHGGWETFDGGMTADLGDVFGTSGSDIFTVGSSGTILHFDGFQWRAMESPASGRLWAVWGVGGTDAFAVGDSNAIVHFDGWLWRKMDDDPEKNDHFKSVWGRSGTDVYAVGDDGMIEHYDGVRWRRMASGTEAGLRRIQGTPGGVLFAVDSGGAVLRAEAVTLSLPEGAEEGAGAGAVQGMVRIPSPRTADLLVSLYLRQPVHAGRAGGGDDSPRRGFRGI